MIKNKFFISFINIISFMIIFTINSNVAFGTDINHTNETSNMVNETYNELNSINDSNSVSDNSLSNNYITNVISFDQNIIDENNNKIEKYKLISHIFYVVAILFAIWLIILLINILRRSIK